MKITDRRKNNPPIEFNQLEIGNVFQVGEDIYMKVCYYYYTNEGDPYDNALWLNGPKGVEAYHFERDAIIVLREAELTLQ